MAKSLKIDISYLEIKIKEEDYIIVDIKKIILLL